MNRDLDLRDDFYFQERRRRLIHNRPFDVDSWCDFLKEETFETFCFALSYEESVAMSMYYRVHVIHQKRHKFTEEHQKLVENVERKIREIMEENPNEDGFFVRLGTRSPKDAVLFDGQGLTCCNKMKKMLEDFFREFHINEEGKINEDDEKDTVANKEFSFLMKASCYSLGVSNSTEAMEMLLNSERVYTDLLLCLDFKDLYAEHPLKMIIRKWNKNLPYRNEFRCFVRDNKMNACSQYDNYIYFPKLFRDQEKMSRIVKTYFDTKIAPLMKENGYTNYTIDIGVLRDDTPIVIELNSFDETDDQAKCGTGSACFSWKTDLKVLREGPYEFRVTDKPPFENMETQVAPDWMSFINKTRRKILREREELALKKKEEEEAAGSWCIIL